MPWSQKCMFTLFLDGLWCSFQSKLSWVFMSLWYLIICWLSRFARLWDVLTIKLFPQMIVIIGNSEHFWKPWVFLFNLNLNEVKPLFYVISDGIYSQQIFNLLNLIFTCASLPRRVIPSSFFPALLHCALFFPLFSWYSAFCYFKEIPLHFHRTPFLSSYLAKCHFQFAYVL